MQKMNYRGKLRQHNSLPFLTRKYYLDFCFFQCGVYWPHPVPLRWWKLLACNTQLQLLFQSHLSHRSPKIWKRINIKLSNVDKKRSVFTVCFQITLVCEIRSGITCENAFIMNSRGKLGQSYFIALNLSRWKVSASGRVPGLTATRSNTNKTKI